ncbi:MAG: response regulator [Flavobacteriales bacterium]|nr:response regulator [Flavobacteriales bacterium]MBP6697332.1 response regulator [Flavobacteriales bacterium]
MSSGPTSSVLRETPLLGSLILPMLLCAQVSEPAFPERTPIDTLDLPFTALTINDGLSQGMVHTILQDDHGFLWFGTKDGLNRYDGYTFTVFRHDPQDSTTIRESTITDLYKDDHGRIWVGTNNGVDLFDRASERFFHVPIEHPNGDWGSIINMTVDRHGDLWVSSTDALVKVTFEAPVEEGRPLPKSATKWYGERYCTVARTRDGRLWGSMAGIAYRITPQHDGRDVIDTLDRFDRRDAHRELHSLAVVEDTLHGKLYGVYLNGVVELDIATGKRTDLYLTRDNLTWLQTDRPVLDPGGKFWLSTFRGLFQFDLRAKRMALVRTADPDMRNMSGTVKRSMIDRNGTLWVGTSGYGLLKYDPRIERFNNQHDGSIRALRPGANGSLVVTRYENFLNVYDPRTRKYTTLLRDAKEVRPDLKIPFTSSDYGLQDEDGVYWMSMTYGNLIRYDERSGQLDLITPKLPTASMDGGGMFPLLLGKGDALWVGGDTGLWRLDRRTMETVLFRWPIPSTSNPYMFVAALHEGPDGIVWAGTMTGLLRLDPKDGSWKHFKHEPNDPRSIAVDIVFSIAADPQDPTGALWLGTNGGGLNRFDVRTGGVTRYTTSDGLPNDVVYGVLSDDAGRLWMSTNKGIGRFDPGTKSFRNFSVGDGLQSDEFNRHAYCKDANGTLYFGGVGGFNWFDPNDLEEDSTAVTVRITDIRLMNKPIVFGDEGSPLSKPVYLSDGMEIPYSANMITFTFAAMEFSAPELHRYRYKLEGFDPDWIDAGSDNSAIYTNLDPGHYTFRVRGMNRDGVWDAHGTSFTLTVLPPWYRTWWFYALCGIVVIGGTLLYIRSLRRQRVYLEKMVKDRTHELSREKDRSEELLKNILPANVAAELKHKGAAEAKHFNNVTVLFSDFKEFTRVSEQLTPTELVEELNVCFNAFDRIMEKYGVEKIKTIGDAYMAAGGVPDPSGGMPLAVVLAGLEMQQIMHERQIERRAQGQPTFEMRVGIHTGPVVAGIVGRRKFQYDIWGDTVNIASRMETTGEPGEVNISNATYALVKDEPDLLFTPRGKVTAKGKGEMEMYYVRARSIQDIVDAEPIKPEPAASIAEVTLPMDELPMNVQQKSTLCDLKILIAEDNEFNALVAQGQLENWVPGVRIVHAVNGMKAVDAMRAGHFDVVLMDIQMPEMNGYDATRAIRALGGVKARIPIIAMSANVMKAEIDRCKEAGMNAFVPKPYKREELLTAIAQVLEKSEIT